MRDIRIRITNKADTNNLITHALDVGYCVDLSKEQHFLDADFLILAHNQSMRWCEEAIFITALNYTEMSSEEFLNYNGEKNN